MLKSIPLHEPKFEGNEKKYLNQCINSTWVSTTGKFINTFEHKIAKYTGSKHAIFCINGTTALQISLKIVGVKEGDEVIAPTLTFIAPINAIKYNNANPIFMDSDDYFNLDEEKTIEFINKETFFKNGYTINKLTKKVIRALIVVHVFGNAAKINKLILLCKKRNIKIVEDASESLGTFYKKNKKHTGTIGDIGCISFNGNKIITAGAGGIILTNSNHSNKTIRYLIKQAKDNSFKFIHNNIGYNFAQTNINAALGLAQLEKLNEIIRLKSKLHNEYKQLSLNLKNITLCETPKYARNNNWLNIIKVKKNHRNKILKRLLSKNIQARPIWYLNHLQKQFKNNQFYKISKASELYNESICLPSSYHLKQQDVKKILKNII